MANWSNLAGTVLGYIRIGLSGVRLKNSSGTLAVRNAGDTADAPINASAITGLTTALSTGQGGTGLTSPGTSGNVLTSNGTDWVSSAAAGGGGALVLLSTITATAAATMDIEHAFDSTYDDYIIMVSGIALSDNGVSILARLKFGGAYATAAYYEYHVHIRDSGNGGYQSLVSSSDTSFPVLNALGNSSNMRAQLQMNFSQAATYLAVRFEGAGVASTYRATGATGTTYYRGADAPLQGIRLYPAAGTFSAVARIYGVAK